MLVTFGVAVSGCSSFSDASGAGSSAGTTTAGTGGEHTSTPSADESSGIASTAGSAGSGTNSGSSGTGTCYDDTTTGCSEVSWPQVAQTIEVLYTLQSSYYGYSKQEALDTARSVYDNGVLPGSYLEIVSATQTDATYRMHVVVTDSDGLPVPGLSADDFQVALDGGQPGPAGSVTELGEVDPDRTDLELDFSIVIDDSGSVADCDANFVAQGLALLLDQIPAVYEMSLVKFASEVFLAHPRTDDPEALRDTVLQFCTDRGSTALWDAVDVGIADLPQTDAFEAVVVFTDGLDNSSTNSLDDVIDNANAAQAPVFILGLGLPDMFALLKLADETGGAFVYVNSGQRILEGFETLTDFVRHSYVIEVPADSAPGSIEVIATLPSGVVFDVL